MQNPSTPYAVDGSGIEELRLAAAHSEPATCDPRHSVRRGTGNRRLAHRPPAH